jgi:hypothetical protein
MSLRIGIKDLEFSSASGPGRAGFLPVFCAAERKVKLNNLEINSSASRAETGTSPADAGASLGVIGYASP